MTPAISVAASAVLCAALAAPTLGPVKAVTPARSEGQLHARVAAGPDGFLAVWAAGIGGRSKIRAARLAADGTSLDPEGFDVATAPGGCFEPAVAYGHGTWLVVWSDLRGGDHEVRAVRVGTDAVVKDAGVVALADEPTPSRMPDVAATADGFVVVWAQAAPHLHGFSARARRLGADGAPLGDVLHVNEAGDWKAGEDFTHSSLSLSICQSPRVAVQGTQAVVFWGGTVEASQGYPVVRAVVDLQGFTVSTAAENAVPEAKTRIFLPEVVPFGADGYAFTWTDYRERGAAGLDDGNFGVMASDGTTVFGGFADPQAVRTAYSPALAGSGVLAFVEPWQNPARNRRTEYHLFVRSFAADATSPGADVQVEGEGAWPALASGPAGTLLVYTVVNAAEGGNGALLARGVTP